MKETAKPAPEQTPVLSPGICVSRQLAGHLALHLSSQLSREVVKCYPLLLWKGSGGASASVREGSWSPSSGCSSRRAGRQCTPTQAGCPCEHQTSSFSEQQSPTSLENDVAQQPAEFKLGSLLRDFAPVPSRA